MKVLITGAKGQIGQELVLLFTQQGHQVIALDSQALDISKEEQVKKTIIQHKDAQFIINCASYTGVDKAENEEEQAYLVNALAVKYLASYAKENNIALIHLSTDYIFDGTKNNAYNEDDPANPLNIYGKTKWQGEEFLRTTWERHIILRTSWVFGRFGNNFVKTMLQLFSERNELNVINNQYGCPTHAKDIAKTILKICEHNLNKKAHWGTYNYCGTPETTWYDFACKIYELAQIEHKCQIKPISSKDYQTPAKRPKNSVLSCEKIKHDFGILPSRWDIGLKSVLTELRKKS